MSFYRSVIQRSGFLSYENHAIVAEIRELTYGTDLTVDGAYLTVNVPEFEVYATLIIKK